MMSGPKQAFTNVGADKTCSSGYQEVHGESLRTFSSIDQHSRIEIGRRWILASLQEAGPKVAIRKAKLAPLSQK